MNYNVGCCIENWMSLMLVILAVMITTVIFVSHITVPTNVARVR